MEYLVRGKKILPTAPDAFQRLIDSAGKFRVPTVFVTNAGNKLRHHKAEQLSEWLNVEVHEDQVVMAHSPLKLFDQFFEKQMLVSGQGPVREIANNLGFTKITTIDDMRAAYPQLDCVDHKRRSVKPESNAPVIPRIEGLLLFGEPVRFGHGAFLLCLEALFKKVTGKDLIYTALVGKPSEITYYHSETMVQHHARKIGINHPITTLYAIGDNIHTDIFGMNLYKEYLLRRRGSTKKIAMQGARGLDLSTHDFKGLTAENCYSVLVKTGVYNENEKHVLEHSPRDFLPVEAKLQEPSITVGCVYEAIDTIFRRENFS
ncbi:Cat eye syndrome critical region protein 5 [Armadillidium vulgare]|nr:Cat eye syndrome critical region protein 5 [Armadillidium vulgare]